MKSKSNILFIFITVTYLFASCKSAKKPEVTSTTGDTKIVNAAGTPKILQDSQAKVNVTVSKISGNANQDAINYIVPENVKEMIWLRSAIDRGINKDLRASAIMMMVDQKKLSKQMADLVANKKYYIPAIDTTNEVTINDKIGSDWDKAWNGKMVADHMQLLTMLEKAKNAVTDSDLHSIIIKNIPIVQSHLNMAQALDKKIR